LNLMATRKPTDARRPARAANEEEHTVRDRPAAAEGARPYRPVPPLADMSLTQALDVELQPLALKTEMAPTPTLADGSLTVFGDGAVIEDLDPPETAVLPPRSASAVERDELMRTLEQAAAAAAASAEHAKGLRGSGADEIRSLIDDAAKSLQAATERLR
jgi:hypothetical protein